MQTIVHVQREPFDRFGSLPETAAKAEERRRVADFIVEHSRSRPGVRRRIVSMPSNNWLFETQLRPRIPCWFTCVERDAWRLMQGRQQIPFATGQQWREWVCGFETLCGFDGDGRDEWSVFNSDLASLLGLQRQFKGGKEGQIRWRQLFKNWGGAWIDYNGPITDRNFASLRFVWSHTNRQFSTVPIVVSYGVGRERGVFADLLREGEREHWVMQALRGMDLAKRAVEMEKVECWRHPGQGNVIRETLFVLAHQLRGRASLARRALA